MRDAIQANLRTLFPAEDGVCATQKVEVMCYALPTTLQQNTPLSSTSSMKRTFSSASHTPQ